MTELKVVEGMNLDSVQAFEIMEENAGFHVTPCEETIDLDDRTKFTKLQLNSGQKMQMNALLQQTPQAIAAGTLAKAYTVSFPEGLPHTLVNLKQGGFGSMIHSEGKFVGSASFHPIASQAAALGAFTAMSAVTGQYFLTQINSELNVVNKKLDDILGFLYGDKKAELMAEISFVKYAHSNFSTIMMHEDQRVATITSLQAAKKVAMKNIEFYLNDLTSISEQRAKDYQGLCDQLDMAMKLKDSIEMSRQLYVVSGLLELYYSQNYEKEYISFVENEMIAYVNKCDSYILSGLGAFQGKFSDYKAKPRPIEKVEGREKYIETIKATLEPYKDGSDSPLRIAMHEALDALHRKAEYYVSASGDIYTRNIA